MATGFCECPACRLDTRRVLDASRRDTAERIRMFPAPGTATENDVLEVERQTGRSCELIDGTLVEKTMGYIESFIAVKIIYLLQAFVETHDSGIVLGEAGTLRDPAASGASS